MHELLKQCMVRGNNFVSKYFFESDIHAIQPTQGDSPLLEHLAGLLAASYLHRRVQNGMQRRFVVCLYVCIGTSVKSPITVLLKHTFELHSRAAPQDPLNHNSLG